MVMTRSEVLGTMVRTILFGHTCVMGVSETRPVRLQGTDRQRQLVQKSFLSVGLLLQSCLKLVDIDRPLSGQQEGSCNKGAVQHTQPALGLDYFICACCRPAPVLERMSRFCW